MPNDVLYGFHSLKDLFAKRITEVGVEKVDRAISATIEEHNRQISALRALFARSITQHQLRYRTPTASRLQPLDEYGRARPIKPKGFYDTGFPLQMAGSAWGATFLAKAKMSVEDANDNTATLLGADIRWMRDHILAALFANVNWTFNDEEFGALTVKGLANGDTDKYLIMEGADLPVTDNHYLAQAAAIADGTNPYPVIYDELVEHPENTGDIVALIPTNLVATTEALTNFVQASDPNIAEGASTDRLVGSLGAAVPGKVIGYADKVWVAEWRSLPDNYIIGVSVGAEEPLAMREDPEPELQGFIRVADREDHPFYESQYMRRAGFGAWNRVGALVYRIGNASYAVPSGYASPMA